MFPLTPLIDVMFLLLIFFMLSSQISPYSLMQVDRIARSDGAGGAGRARPDLVVRLSRGFVSIGGEAIAADHAAAAFSRLVSQGVSGFLVVLSGSATVQDIVTTLEALQAASAPKVTLVNRGGGGR